MEYTEITIRFIDGTYLTCKVTEESIYTLIDNVNTGNTYVLLANNKTVVINTRNITTISYTA